MRTVGNPPKVQIQGVRKVFQVREGWRGHREVVAIDGIDLEVRDGEFVTVIGPSGCGKSTLLMMVAGLYEPSAGTIRLNGRVVDGPGLDRGVVFQDYGLFPWLTVDGNIRFGMRNKGIPRAEQDAIVERLVRMVHLEGFSGAHPWRLSGGMKQRVALARALAYDPDVLLMDEPFGALDAQTRYRLQVMLVDVWQQTRKTVLFVTHSVREAVFLSDRIVVLSRRPSRIRAEVPIELPRPRDVLSPAFREVESHVSALLGSPEQHDDPERDWAAVVSS